MNNNNRHFKVCLIGAQQTGKTTFLQHCLKDQSVHPYWPTFTVEIHPLLFNTNDGEYQLIIWDLSGQEKFIINGHYLEASAALAFYTSETIEQTNKIVEEFQKNCPSATIINLWNFSDLPEQEKFVEENLKTNQSVIKQGNRKTYQISILKNENCEQPLIDLLMILTKNPNLVGFKA